MNRWRVPHPAPNGIDRTTPAGSHKYRSGGERLRGNAPPGPYTDLSQVARPRRPGYDTEG